MPSRKVIIIEPWGARYKWLDEVYLNWLNGEKPTESSYREFHTKMEELDRRGCVELSKAGDLRTKLAKQRGTLAINNLMEKTQKKMLREGVINRSAWMYQANKRCKLE